MDQNCYGFRVLKVHFIIAMGASTVKPFSEAECKAIKKFTKSYKKHHADLDEDEVKRSAENAWGKLLPHQKKYFEVSMSQLCFYATVFTTPVDQVRPKETPVKRMLPAARKKPKNQKKKAVPKWRYRSRKRPLAKPTPNPNNPAMSTAFIGFLREYQRRNTIVDVKKRLQRAAKMWSKLSKAQKNKFRTAVSICLNFQNPDSKPKCFEGREGELSQELTTI